jgi:hypothetical protein
MAFVINLYNTLIRIAFVTAGKSKLQKYVIQLKSIPAIILIAKQKLAGIPKNDLTRLSFFDTVAVNIGGDIFTFNDLENGIFRANSVPPYHLTKPFGKGDLRESLALTQTELALNFELWCQELPSCEEVFCG